MYDLNAAAPLQFLVKDAAGAAANATTVTITITLAGVVVVNGTTVTPTLTGQYDFNGPTTTAGRYLVYWQGTGTNFTAKSDQYDVRSSASAALLSLADAKDALNIPQADHTQDEEIRDKVDAVTGYIEARIGPVVPQSVTRTVVANGSGFFLPGPVISITSLTPALTNGSLYTAADFYVTSGGTVARLDGSWLNGQPYTVVYQAGMTVIPAPLLEAAKLLLQHLWKTQRPPGLRPSQASDDTLDMDAPPRVKEALHLYRIVSVA